MFTEKVKMSFYRSRNYLTIFYQSLRKRGVIDLQLKVLLSIVILLVVSFSYIIILYPRIFVICRKIVLFNTNSWRKQISFRHKNETRAPSILSTLLPLFQLFLKLGNENIVKLNEFEANVCSCPSKNLIIVISFWTTISLIIKNIFPKDVELTSTFLFQLH